MLLIEINKKYLNKIYISFTAEETGIKVPRTDSTNGEGTPLNRQAALPRDSGRSSMPSHSDHELCLQCQGQHPVSHSNCQHCGAELHISSDNPSSSNLATQDLTMQILDATVPHDSPDRVPSLSPGSSVQPSIELPVNREEGGMPATTLSVTELDRDSYNSSSPSIGGSQANRDRQNGLGVQPSQALYSSDVQADGAGNVSAEPRGLTNEQGPVQIPRRLVQSASAERLLAQDDAVQVRGTQSVPTENQWPSTDNLPSDPFPIQEEGQPIQDINPHDPYLFIPTCPTSSRSAVNIASPPLRRSSSQDPFDNNHF